jgi:hypothetical protein
MTRVAVSLARLRTLAAKVPEVSFGYTPEEPTFGPPCSREEVDELLGAGRDLLAGSFAEFLERVVFDWEHCISGDDPWEYLV